MFKCRSHRLLPRVTRSVHSDYCSVYLSTVSPLVRPGLRPGSRSGLETGFRSDRPLLRQYTNTTLTTQPSHPFNRTSFSRPLTPLYPSHYRSFSSSILVNEEIAVVQSGAEDLISTFSSVAPSASSITPNPSQVEAPVQPSRLSKKTLLKDHASTSNDSRLHSSKRLSPPRNHLAGAKHHLSAKRSVPTLGPHSLKREPLTSTKSVFGSLSTLDSTELPTTDEPISPSIQILCEALEQARIARVHGSPPVFVASTYNQAENAMHLFEQYYSHTAKGGPGTVGFDTETSTDFIRDRLRGVSLVQIATRDICLFFQVYRITRQNRDKTFFPPRLRAFLEDPEQLMAGVGIEGDARDLKASYGIDCAGLVDLSKMAKERDYIPRSLAELDAMFGVPGREVVKSKAILKWNWDLERYRPQWVWYAAKDAFAGQAIYENMLQGKIKSGYRSYLDQNPMTNEEEFRDAFQFLTRSLGKGTVTTVDNIEKILTKSYSRFRKAYLGNKVYEKAQQAINTMLEKGQLIARWENSETTLPQKTDPIQISGRSTFKVLFSPAGIDVLSPLFNHQQVELSQIRSSGYSPINMDAQDQESLDQMDFGVFMNMANAWNGPRRLGALVSVYVYGQRTARAKAGSVQPADIEDDRVNALKFLYPFLKRMKNRGILEQTSDLQWQMVPLLEEQIHQRYKEYEETGKLKEYEVEQIMTTTQAVADQANGEDMIMQESSEEVKTTMVVDTITMTEAAAPLLFTAEQEPAIRSQEAIEIVQSEAKSFELLQDTVHASDNNSTSNHSSKGGDSSPSPTTTTFSTTTTTSTITTTATIITTAAAASPLNHPDPDPIADSTSSTHDLSKTEGSDIKST